MKQQDTLRQDVYREVKHSTLLGIFLRLVSNSKQFQEVYETDQIHSLLRQG